MRAGGRGAPEGRVAEVALVGERGLVASQPGDGSTNKRLTHLLKPSAEDNDKDGDTSPLCLQVAVLPGSSVCVAGGTET